MIPENLAILAMIWGLVIVSIAMPFILLPKLKRHIVDFFKPMIRSKVFGMILFGLGVLHIMFITSWSSNWDIVFTLFGYILLTKGLILITIPSSVEMAQNIMMHPFTNYILIIAFFFGLYLISSGYQALLNP